MNSNRKSYSWQRVNCSYEKGLYMRIERVESLDKRKCKVFTDEDFAFLLYNGELENTVSVRRGFGRKNGEGVFWLF